MQPAETVGQLNAEALTLPREGILIIHDWTISEDDTGSNSEALSLKTPPMRASDSDNENTVTTVPETPPKQRSNNLEGQSVHSTEETTTSTRLHIVAFKTMGSTKIPNA